MATHLALGLDYVGCYADCEVEPDENWRVGWGEAHNPLTSGDQSPRRPSQSRFDVEEDLPPDESGDNTFCCTRHELHSSSDQSGSIFPQLDSAVEGSQDLAVQTDPI
jgi:hypothetical protein